MLATLSQSTHTCAHTHAYYLQISLVVDGEFTCEMEPINREARSRPPSPSPPPLPPNSTRQSRLPRQSMGPLRSQARTSQARCHFVKRIYQARPARGGRKDQATRLPVVYFKVCRFFAATVGCCGNWERHRDWDSISLKGSCPSWWVTSKPASRMAASASTLVLFVMWNMI